MLFLVVSWARLRVMLLSPDIPQESCDLLPAVLRILAFSVPFALSLGKSQSGGHWNGAFGRGTMWLGCGGPG